MSIYDTQLAKISLKMINAEHEWNWQILTEYDVGGVDSVPHAHSRLVQNSPQPGHPEQVLSGIKYESVPSSLEW